MTALAGFWSWSAALPAAEAVTRCTAMLGALRSYGPHCTAHWQASGLAMGRCLYRLLPEDRHDTAPQISSDGRFVLIADVRLDNRDELIATLGLEPVVAAACCDAAIVLAAFQRWDEACVDHLVGDFAFAVWDAQQQRLILARDYLGQRPLYFHEGDGFFALASMPKGLHVLPGIARVPDEKRVAEFLLGLPEQGASCFFTGIRALASGHLAVVTQSGVSLRRYWDPQPHLLQLADSDAYAKALRAHLDQATAARLRGCNGHVGAHLSAGLDSSAVAATAARLLSASGGKVSAFTAVPRTGYDGPEVAGRLINEGPLAAATAAMHPAIEHILVAGTACSPLDGLEQAVEDFERPLLNLCNHVWLTGINREAQQRGIRVVLWGQFGNLGLSFDGKGLLPHLVATRRWKRWWREALALTRTRRIGWTAVFKASVGPWIPLRLWQLLHWRTWNANPEMSRYCAIHPRYLADFDLEARALALGGDLQGRPSPNSFDARVRAVQGVDLGNLFKGVLARWGVDLRDPTADRRLVEFSLAVPLEQYQSDGVPRALALRALADRLPPEVLQERRKGLQGVDWHEGLTRDRATLAEELRCIAADERASRIVDSARLLRLLEQWPQHGWERPEINLSYRAVLLRGVAAGYFLRHAAARHQFL